MSTASSSSSPERTDLDLGAALRFFLTFFELTELEGEEEASFRFFFETPAEDGLEEELEVAWPPAACPAVPEEDGLGAPEEEELEVPLKDSVHKHTQE